jgi:hypothetical protein
MTSIAAMPMQLRPILLALILGAMTVLAAGCGDDGPDPSIPQDDATTLIAKIQEIEANVDNGSCLVAADRTDDLISDIEALPPDVNDDVKQALLNGANNLRLQLADPDKCEGRTTTTEPTTTEETSTEEPTTTRDTTPDVTTTPTQTQTTPTQTQTTQTSPSGGVGPGSSGGL